MSDAALRPVPPFDVLIQRGALLRRIGELAAAMAADFDPPPVCVAVIEGARVFANELTRALPGQPRYHEIRAASYGDGTVSSGAVAVQEIAEIPARGQRVVILEDIVDTGRTVHALRAHFLAQGARAVHTAALLSKPSRRIVDVAIDYLGFEIPDRFVIGFGMDVAGRHRDLPHVALYPTSAG